MPFTFAHIPLQMSTHRFICWDKTFRVAAFILLLFIAFGLIFRVSLVGNTARIYLLWVAIATLGAAIVFFLPSRCDACRLAAKANHNETLTLPAFSQGVRENSLTFNPSSAPEEMAVRVLVELMNLKSAILFAGPDIFDSKLVASAGERAEEVLHCLGFQLGVYGEYVKGQDFVELPWGSGSLLLISLTTADRRFIGHAVLGPKESGEVFAEEEKQALALIIPILAVVIDFSELYQRLKGVNERLVRTLGERNLHLAKELKVLNERLLEAREEERACIAADLHDGPLQKAMLLIQRIDRYQNDAETLAHQLASELRETASRLRPAILDDLGIVPALEWLICDMTRNSNLNTCLLLHNFGKEERLPPDIELVLFRIAQEAINNAMKHSEGTFLDVCLSRDGDNIVLQVTDNGTGFSSASQANSGFGLLGMHRRAFQLGGSFTVRPAPGQGTTVIALIPLFRRN